jgi:UV DNA damage endonuclease
MRYGLCCISLNLKDQGHSFKTMTYKKFASMDRDEALEVLGDRILNNMVVTNEHLLYCARNNLVYRLSSDLFPLITYELAGVDLVDLPQIEDIYDQFEVIEQTIRDNNLRVSTHPDQFNVLASTNKASVDRTVNELNFFSSFMDIIGCPADHNAPINLHINNKQGSYDEIIDRFLTTFNRLDPNCRNRLVIENDDKSGGWNVAELIEHFYPATNIPITFDYLHHKCNPSYDEETAVRECYNTWDTRPLFHYSESREGNNPRAHADYATQPFDTYGLDFDIDMELKMKDHAISSYLFGKEVLV